MVQTRRILGMLAVVVALAAACGSSATDSEPTGRAANSAQADGAALIVNWQSLGCAEPAPLHVPSSAALAQDVGSAAPEYAAEHDVSLSEAMRRLGL